jgi:hypothetical protein
MNKNTLRQGINLLALLVTLIVNGLANGLPLNGQTTGEISDRFDVLFVPAGYVFSIWGLIYLGLIAYGVYQALPSQRDNLRLRRIDAFFILSCLANSAWIFLWHYNLFPLSLLVMLVLLGSLIAIYLHLDIGRVTVSLAEKWMVHVPFSVYLGWITVATIANATTILDYIGWSGWGISEQGWTAVMLAAALAIALAVTLTRRDVAYLLVLVWAFAGIAVKHSGVPLVASTAGLAAALAALMAVLSGFSGGGGRGRRFIMNLANQKSG